LSVSSLAAVNAEPIRRQGDPAWSEWTHELDIAVIIPCYNEEVAIPHVVRAVQGALPTARIYVFDNNSSDSTVAAAHAAGAIVRWEVLQGKGHVIRRAFADVEADIYVLIDGDATYDAAVAPQMIRMLVEKQLDMVTGTRISDIAAAYRTGHRFGNRLLTGLVQMAFGKRITDMLSGYRVFSRRFVKSFPALSAGFETETELTIHALELRMPIGEIATAYRERPAGSMSKLRTIRDGLRIFRTILILVKEERPLPFFSLCGSLILLFGLVLSMPVLMEFAQTGLVPRLPTAVLSASLVLLSFLSFFSGLILDSVARGRKEMKRLAYLSIGAVADRF
jgi:glycosyltransferase involved in cell wall biosynthesis